MPLIPDATCVSFPSNPALTYTFVLVTARARADRAHLLVFVDTGPHDGGAPSAPILIVKNAVCIGPKPVASRRYLTSTDTALTITSDHPDPGLETGRLEAIVTETGGELVVIEHGLSYDYGDQTMQTQAFFNAHFALTLDDTFHFKSVFQTYEHPIVSMNEDQEGNLREYQVLALKDWRFDHPLPPEIAGPLEKWRAQQG